MTATLLIDDATPGVRTLTLNRPERMNAFDGDMLSAFHDAITGCAKAATEVKVIVVRGSGRAFCAGNDLKHMARILDDGPAFMHHQDLMQKTYEALEAAPQAVVASINGFALAGGFELALACDIIVADEAAELGDEHIRRNFVPSGGSSQRLPRRVGLPRALYYLMTGRRMSGREAERLGLASIAVPAAELDAVTQALAVELARADGKALSTVKQMARRGMELPLKDGLWLEQWMQHRYRLASPELDQGVRDFAARGKGKPEA